MEYLQQEYQPLVTVIVGCYNHARFVKECLDSVLAQTYRKWELLIWDDGSTDDSVAVIDNWIERNNVQCTFLRHAKNIGICRSFNEVMLLSHGKYLSTTAADDVWLPQMLEPHVAILEKQPEKVGVVYSDAYQIDENGNLLPSMFIEAHRRLDSFPQGSIHDLLWEGNFIPGMATTVRHRDINLAGV